MVFIGVILCTLILHDIIVGVDELLIIALILIFGGGIIRLAANWKEKIKEFIEGFFMFLPIFFIWVGSVTLYVGIQKPINFYTIGAAILILVTAITAPIYIAKKKYKDEGRKAVMMTYFPAHMFFILVTIGSFYFGFIKSHQAYYLVLSALAGIVAIGIFFKYYREFNKEIAKEALEEEEKENPVKQSLKKTSEIPQ